MKTVILLALFSSGLLLTSSCFSADKRSEAVNCDQEYESIVKQHKANAGAAHRNRDYYKHLADQISNLLPACPNHSGLKAMMANTQVSLGKNLTALAYANEAIEIDKNNADAIYTKGMILALEGEIAEAIRLLERSIELAPDNVYFMVGYCSTLESAALYKEAIAICSSVLERQDAPPVVFYIRGRAYEAMGQEANAQQDYEKARQLGFRTK